MGNHPQKRWSTDPSDQSSLLDESAPAPFNPEMHKPLLAFGLIWAMRLVCSAEPAFPTNTFRVHVQVDASKEQGTLHPVWRFFGADEPNYATMKNGRKLIGELGSLRPKDVYFRAHNLLTS